MTKFWKKCWIYGQADKGDSTGPSVTRWSKKCSTKPLTNLPLWQRHLQNSCRVFALYLACNFTENRTPS